MKLAIGTAQFGLSYGINNLYGVPSDAELEKIMNLAFQSGIDTLDTAQTYGNAESRISKFLNEGIKVVTKFKEFDARNLFKSLNNLSIDSIYGYISHDADKLNDNKVWWDGLLKAKTDGYVKKIGYSLYNIDQLESLLSNDMFPDIVQLPYNILDTRFEPYLSELHTRGAEIHVRSVFLQGLFHMELNRIPNNLNPLKPYIIKIKEVAAFAQISISEVCLGFVNANSYVDRIVVGVDNYSQLNENVNHLLSSKLTNQDLEQLRNINIEQTYLLNPANWKS